MTSKTVSQEIDDWIVKVGKGNIRDALNIALARLSSYQRKYDMMKDLYDRAQEQIIELKGEKL
jgi:hypothetical protein